MFIFTLSLLLFQTAVAAQKPCCYPPLFTISVSEVSYTSRPSSIGTQLVMQNGTFYGDKDLNKFTQNMTVYSLVQEQPPQQVTIINDYNKDVQYMIVDNKLCIQQHLSGEPSACIPANSTYIGFTKLGVSYAVERWLFPKTSGLYEEITVTTDKCLPVTYTYTKELQDGANYDVSVYEYYNFKPNVTNPDDVFTPPVFCNHDQVTSIDQVPEHMLPMIDIVKKSSPFRRN